jgi:uncharacterized membrane protein
MKPEFKRTPGNGGKIVLLGSLGGIVAVYGYTAHRSSEFAIVAMAMRQSKVHLLSNRSIP